jgi:hypothetical protein
VRGRAPPSLVRGPLDLPWSVGIRRPRLAARISGAAPFRSPAEDGPTVAESKGVAGVACALAASMSGSRSWPDRFTLAPNQSPFRERTHPPSCRPPEHSPVPRSCSGRRPIVCACIQPTCAADDEQPSPVGCVGRLLRVDSGGRQRPLPAGRRCRGNRGLGRDLRGSRVRARGGDRSGRPRGGGRRSTPATGGCLLGRRGPRLGRSDPRRLPRGPQRRPDLGALLAFAGGPLAVWLVASRR